LAEEIGTIQGLKNSFNPILNVILLALDAPAIFMRTKALRALGQIVMSDDTILAAVCRHFSLLHPWLTPSRSQMCVEESKAIFSTALRLFETPQSS